MAWDDEKKNFGTDPRVSDNKKLTAEEWNQHVQDQIQKLEYIIVEDSGSTIVNAERLNFGDNLSVGGDGETATITATASTSSGSSFNYATGFVNWGGLTDTPVNRYELDTGYSLEVSEIQFLSKGGGSENTAASVEVYDLTDGTSVTSTNLNTTAKPNATSTSGSVIQIRVTNGTGSPIDAAITIRGDLV